MPSLPESPLVEQIRAARPRAPEALRARIVALPEPLPEEPRRRLWGRRALLVLVPAATIAVVAGLAVVGGRTGGDGTDEQAASGTATTAFQRARPEAAQDSQQLQPGVAPPPSRTRAQDYRAQLTVRVENLNGTTARAMRITRRLGGYIVRADLDSPEVGDGTSRLVVRVPVGKVQQAIVQFSALGELVAQQITISDLQRDLDRRTDRIQSLRNTIAKLEEDGVTEEERLRIARLEEQIRAEQRRREEVERRGRLSRIVLTLTTREAEEAVKPDGEIESAVRDALRALDDIVAVVLYGLIVAGPFVLLALLAVALERRRRHRADERLLERPAP
jgi:hypothetical protein